MDPFLRMRYFFLLCAGIVGVYWFGSSEALAVVLTLWISTGGYHTLFIAYHTLGRDLRAARMMIRLMWMLKSAEWKNWTVPKMFAETVEKHPEKIMLIFEDSKWTFNEVDLYSNRVGNFFSSKGFKKGDAIALFMETRPEFVGIWLGLAKIGVVPALINFNLRKQNLVHSISVADCKAIIYGVELQDAVESIMPILKDCDAASYPAFCTGGSSLKFPESSFSAEDLDNALEQTGSHTIDQKIQNSLNFTDKLMYIYTSGTTGLPKAAVIKHSRYILASGGSTIVIGCKKDDVVYAPLPLYHSVAGMISLSGTMHFGISLILRKKFSATNYWDDCIKYKATVGQYIGEIARYLLNAPFCESEKNHNVRLMFGNGLRPQVWEGFVKRFNIRNIAEFYGSTEGNSQIINVENRVGAVGFVSILFPYVFPMGLIKIDENTGEVARDANGLCVPCPIGHPGEFVGKIVRNHPMRDFHGYADKSASRKKVLSNVFRKGDLYFRSGDILVQDPFGWLYFKDRTGDTFRWKGENVSTTEVEAIISELVNLRDAIAYGVEIPGCEGKAGMVAINDPDETVDLNDLASKIEDNLPPYARPLFIRLIKTVEMTGTLKLKKVNLQKEGYDLNTVGDKMFFLDPKEKLFLPLSKELHHNIVNNKFRL